MRCIIRILGLVAVLTIVVDVQSAQTQCRRSESDCPLKVEGKNCDTHTCLGVVIKEGNCFGKWIDSHDPICEAEKGKKNAEDAAEKLACDATKKASALACDTVDAITNTASGAANLLDRTAKETTEIGMRVLPGEIRQGVEHLTKEAMKEIDKYPVLAMYLSTTLKLTQPLLARAIDNIVGRSCNAPATIAHLSTEHLPKVTDAAKNWGILTTPAKEWGASGWSPTGCTAQGEGILVQDAVHSSDGFWTIDVALLRLTIDGLEAPPGRYIRIEVENSVPANKYLEGTKPLVKDERILFRGPVLFDNDPPRFLEVHPIEMLLRKSDAPLESRESPPPTTSATWPKDYIVVRGDCLAWIAERTYGRQAWDKVYKANKLTIGDPDLIYPGQKLVLPR